MAHPRPRLSGIRATMRAAILEVESRAVRACVDATGLTRAERASIAARAVELVRTTRARAGSSIMQGFLAEYGLSTREGVALMCLAEALLRVPDTETIDALIEDKIGASDWAVHLGHSSSPLVNASTWALLLTGKVLGETEHGLAGALHDAIKRLGEPVIRAAVAQAMRDIVASAFQSAGRCCSALRILYVQREVEERILEMLFGAIDELRIGNPWNLATDIGPVIDDEARERIESYCRQAERAGRTPKRLAALGGGRFAPPTVLRVNGIEAIVVIR